jgi:glucose-6-phosphate isomerase
MRLRYGQMLQDGLDGEHGIPRRRLAELARRFTEIQAEVRERRAAGEYGFIGLTEQAATVERITRFAEGLGQAYDHVLVLGIGGSALGARALLSALRRPGWNEWDDEGREFFPRLTILDNVDPTTVHAALQRIDPRRVLVNVISKSGGTAETLAQYLVVRHWLEQALGAAASRHFVFTTDPAKGALRELAGRDSIATLDVPPEVGGRFSVLSPVGLLPAALVGIDVAGLWRARAVRWNAPGGRPPPESRGAVCRAPLAADTGVGARIHVMMPYSDRLRDVEEWFRQLWAESLGKRVDRAGNVVHTGPTPVAAVGATDQHSQVQLLMEGPFDKAITFLTVEDAGVDVPIPGRDGLPTELAYLAGKTLGALLRAEYQATSAALARMGRMNCTLSLPDLAPATLGELLMFFQIATGYAGAWYGVNPFDQPGVELGKQLTFAAMGRPGFEGPPVAEPASTDEA